MINPLQKKVPNHLFRLGLALILSICMFKDIGAKNTLPTGGIEPASLYWMQNTGQVSNDIIFHKKIVDGNIAITNDHTIHYTYCDAKGNKGTFSESLVSQAPLTIVPQGQPELTVNYLSGIEKQLTGKKIPVFETLLYPNVWKGIDMALMAKTDNLEKVFTVHPNVYLDIITIQVDGARLKIVKNGELQLKQGNHIQTFTAPVAWQMIKGTKIFRAISYQLKSKHRYGFNVAQYDNAYPLFIDPMLASTLIPGSEFPIITKIDNADNVIIASITESPNISTGGNIFQPNFEGGMYDIILYKFNPNLTKLLACTYIGGAGTDALIGMELNRTNNTIYLVGGSSGFNPPAPIKGHFICQLDANMESLIASYILPANSILTNLPLNTIRAVNNSTNTLTIDNYGFVYYVNYTSRNDLSNGTNGYRSIFSGQGIVPFIYKFPSDLATPVAFTYLCPDSIDSGLIIPNDIFIDNENHLIVAGTFKNMLNFPTTGNAYQQHILTPPAYSNIFISKFSGDLTTLIASTVMSTDSNLTLGNISCTQNNEIILTGNTRSSLLPVTADAQYPTNTKLKPRTASAFITRFKKDLSSLTYCSFLFPDSAYQKQLVYSYEYSTRALVIDKSDNVYLAFEYLNGDTFPFSYDSNPFVLEKPYIKKLSPDLQHTIAATYLGGDIRDNIYHLNVNSRSQVVITGNTNSMDFPLLFQSYYSDLSPYYSQEFIVILDSLLSNLPEIRNSSYFIGLCDEDSVVLSSLIFNARYSWTTGSDSQSIVVKDTGIFVCKTLDGGIIYIDSFFVNHTNKPDLFTESQVDLCIQSTLKLSAFQNSFTNYLWNTDQTTPAIIVSNGGRYSVMASKIGCTVFDTIFVHQKPIPIIKSLRDTTICFDEIDQILLDAGTFKSYLWKPTGETTQTIYSTRAMVYQLTVTDTNDCITRKRVDVMEECPYYIFVPNAFTPNGDGINDLFLPQTRSLTFYNLDIVNSWGAIVFSTQDTHKGWDGKDAQAGVYVVSIRYEAKGKERQFISKNLTLLR